MEWTCWAHEGERNEEQHGWFCMGERWDVRRSFSTGFVRARPGESSGQAWCIRVGEVQVAGGPRMKGNKLVAAGPVLSGLGHWLGLVGCWPAKWVGIWA